MKVVLQPPRSRVCGQACVATLLGVSLSVAITLVRKKGATNMRHLVGPLSDKFMIPEKKLTRIRVDQSLPDRAIVRVRWNAKESHWVVKDGDIIHDPAFGSVTMESYLSAINDIGGRMTSYFLIAKK